MESDMKLLLDSLQCSTCDTDQQIVALKTLAMLCNNGEYCSAIALSTSKAFFLYLHKSYLVEICLITHPDRPNFYMTMLKILAGVLPIKKSIEFLLGVSFL